MTVQGPVKKQHHDGMSHRGLGKGEFRRENLAVKKIPRGEIFAACDQEPHRKSRCRTCSGVPGGGKGQGCVCLQRAVVV